MNWKRLVILSSIAGAAFGVGYGAVAKAWPTPYYTGYFTNVYDAGGVDVFPADSDSPGCPAGGGYAVPTWVDSAPEFINYIKCKLNSPNDYWPYATAEEFGARFIIQTMRGGTDRGWPDAADVADWEARVNYYASRGWINWNVTFGYAFNSYYTGTFGGGTPYDDAFFPNNSSSPSIVFSDGSSSYGIRRACANPVGSGLGGLQQPWSGQGRTTVTDGINTGTAITVQPGANLTFRHYIQNNGPGSANMWYATYGRNDPTTAWTAQYYNNTGLTGSPVLTRTEQDINYIDNSGGLSPGPGVIADGWSARWTRTQNFPAGDHLFTMKVDDGGRLYVDGALVLDAWVSQGATPYSITRNLTAGNHTIELRYFEGGGPGWATLDYTNYIVQGGTNAGGFSSGEERNVNTQSGVIVPLNATPGTQFCRRILWDWRNSSAAGEWGLGTAGMGALACATVAANYDLTPAIVAEIGGVAVPGNIAEAGQTLLFRYRIANSASGPSPNVNCNIVGLTRTGAYNVPTPYDSVSDPGFSLSSGCPQSFAASSNVQIQTEGIDISAMANRTICRSLFVNPATPAGISRGTEICVKVVTKPYARTYGGDLSAGGGVQTAPGVCSQDTNAAIIGWNKRGSGGSYSGAAVQFAAYAMNTIFDTATTLNNGAGSAVTPTGFGFGNTVTSVGNGRFGGAFGTAACIPDYYATKPSGSLPAVPATVAAMTSGSYSSNGPLQLGGGSIINPNNRITVYVEGNVFISSGITYSGSWTSGSMPLFRLIVHGGNIYIDNDVTRLDGLYVAQPNGAVGGHIYTCAVASDPYNPFSTTAANFDTQCDVKLTVNGAFVAKQVRLLRTIGTLQSSSAGEGSGSPNAAEVFNYSPIMWIPQPSSTSSTAGYDAINSLPPVL